MRHKISVVAAAVLLWQLSAFQAHAQDANEEPAKTGSAKLLDEALQDYFAKDPRSAARKLFDFLAVDPRTDENHAWAQFFLGKSLADLGMRHAGAEFLARVARERSNPAVLPKALAELRVLSDSPHDEKMIDEEVFGALDLGFLPDDLSAYAHYQQGLMSLKLGNERWAQNHFAKLAEGTPEFSRAKYAVLVTRLKALKGEVPSELIEEFAKLGDDPKLTVEMRNESWLAVSRLRYEKKDYQGALEANQKVQLPPLDPGQASLYLEEAWIRYRLGQVRAAMGLLTALDAPTFRDVFLPDKYLLRASIYRDLCHYLPAKRAAKELTRRFADSLEAIHNRDDLTRDLRIRRAADAEGPTRRAARFVEALRREEEEIARNAGGLGEHLVTYLTKLYDLEQAEARRTHELRVKEAVRKEADRLLQAAEQVRLMDYEVGLKLYERVKQGQRLVATEEDEAPKAAQVSFPFDGEYWNDELRNYRFTIQSRCSEDAR